MNFHILTTEYSLAQNQLDNCTSHHFMHGDIFQLHPFPFCTTKVILFLFRGLEDEEPASDREDLLMVRAGSLSRPSSKQSAHFILSGCRYLLIKPPQALGEETIHSLYALLSLEFLTASSVVEQYFYKDSLHAGKMIQTPHFARRQMLRFTKPANVNVNNAGLKNKGGKKAQSCILSERKCVHHVCEADGITGRGS